MDKINFLFVVDGKQHQEMAIILASSIRLFHGESPDIYAYTPSQRYHELSEIFQESCRIFDIKHRSFENEDIDWREPYPHGNKVVACAQVRNSGDFDVFLDTDTMLLNQLNSGSICQHNTVSAVPEGVPTWGRNAEDWVPVYKHFGLEIPSENIRLVRGRRKSVKPYFNAGFVAFPTAKAEGTNFGQIWLDTALEVDKNVNIENKRPWLDQITMPVAIRRSGMMQNVLDEFHNFSLFGRDNTLAQEIALAHYHLPAIVAKYPSTRRIVEVTKQKIREAGIEQEIFSAFLKDRTA